MEKKIPQLAVGIHTAFIDFILLIIPSRQHIWFKGGLGTHTIKPSQKNQL
jgi:hypothetical protein